jgi:ABC-type phosphate/phosphonate transport system ATPase subunit
VDVKKTKKKQKKQKEKKTKNMKNACLFLFQGFFIMRRQKNKEGFNILIGSRCRNTNLYESCISKFR